MPLEKLVNLTGSLSENFYQLNPDTLQHADEITLAQQNQAELRSQSYLAADFIVYTRAGEDIILNLARRQDNLIFKNFKEASQQLVDTDNYALDEKLVQPLVQKDTTLKVKVAELGLEDLDEESGSFDVDVDAPEKLNPAQRAVAERLLGTGEAFVQSLKIYKEQGPEKIIPIYVLLPGYVQEKLGEGQALARACSIGNYAGFFLDDNNLDGDFYTLRGELKEKAAVEEPKPKKKKSKAKKAEATPAEPPAAAPAAPKAEEKSPATAPDTAAPAASPAEPPAPQE